MDLLQEWEWLLWAAIGVGCAWVVLTDAYSDRPSGQGRE